MLKSGRRNREKKTVEVMIRDYCRGFHHYQEGLCKICQALLTYALKRIDFCRYGEQKPVCSRCPSPCYNQDKRSRIIAVMRYSGPKMIYRHPYLALSHFLDTRRQVKK